MLIPCLNYVTFVMLDERCRIANSSIIYSNLLTLPLIACYTFMLQNPPPKLTFSQSFQKLIRSFAYAFNGIKYATLTELNFRIHLVATLLTVVAGYALHINYNEWLWVGLCITLVLVTELLNTAIERLTDLVSPTYHPIAGHVKDIAAGAVTIMTLFALTTGCVIFLPKLIKLINHAA